MRNRIARLPLFWKTLVSTAVAITLLCAVTGWIVQDTAVRLTRSSLAEEVRGSLRAYESLWNARADMLATVSRVLARMPDVRAAFSTGDSATIRDTAGEIWSRISRDDAIFLVTDPHGSVIASLGGHALVEGIRDIAEVRTAAPAFPAQASGFLVTGGRMFQIAVTPVYVESPRGPVLLNVLVAGYSVDTNVARRLKQATGGSDFVFLAGGRVVASSLDRHGGLPAPDADAPADAAMSAPLASIDGRPLGELRIYRSFDAARQHIAGLRRNLLWIWGVSIAVGLGLSVLLARRIVTPVEKLDVAASELARGNYACRVEITNQDELGRLARTFNQMCDSLRQAREELIRQERISTIARLSTSLVHDLRNPLAAIYGGAELLVDGTLSEAQVGRLANNIYRASRRIQSMLQELVDASRDSRETREAHSLAEVVATAVEAHAEAAAAQAVRIEVTVPAELDVAVERGRLERVFQNLIGNALEAMPCGGRIRIRADRRNGSVVVAVEDNGPGISPDVAPHLFQPFATAGKKNGLGLGLALSRQTLLDHGGDLWAGAPAGLGGACFYLRLPLAAAGHVAA